MLSTSSSSLRCGVAFVLGLLAATACAGHYQITITGGNFQRYDGATQTAPYLQTGTQDSVYYEGGDDDRDDYGANPFQTSSDCNGPLTAVCQWQSDTNEPAPNTIVVRETVSAQGAYPDDDDGTAAGTTNVSGETTYDEDFSDDIHIGAYVTRYTVMHNASSFTLTCSPEASATKPDIGNDGAASYVGYGVDVAVPSIALTGGLNNGASFLIGQRLTAQLPSVLGLTPATGGGGSQFSWSVQGGSPFQKFFVDAISPAPYSVGYQIPLSTADLQASSLTCCFSKTADPATVSCTSAHFAVPAGSLPTAGLDVTLDPVTTVVVKPNIEPVVVSKSSIVLDQPTSSQDGSITLYGSNGTTYARKVGINYRSSVTTPEDFCLPLPGSTDIKAKDRGGFRWVQLIATSRSRNLIDGTAQTLQCGPSTDFRAQDPPYWTSGLDTLYPYEPGPDMPNTTSVNRVDPTDNHGNMYVANGGKDAQGNLVYPGEAGDTPSEPLHLTDSTTGSSSVHSYNVRDDFTVWQLYRPPGPGSQFVPVQSFHWWWFGSVFAIPSDDGSVGTWSASLGMRPPFGNDFDSITPLDSVTFPNWTRLFAPYKTTYRNN